MATIEEIKKFRELTHAPVGDCRIALEKSGGNFEKALEYLRSLGKEKVEKKAHRATGAGHIFAYVHHGGQIGVLLDLRSETDFVARSEEFKKLGHELCLQVAAMNPLFIRREDVPDEVAQKFKKEKNEEELKELILMEQPYIKNQDITVADLIAEYVGKVGEHLEVNRFMRFDV